MRKIAAIILFTLYAFGASTAQEQENSGGFLLENDKIRSDIFNNRLAIYKAIPTNLWQWDYGNISTISFKGNYETGDFKTVDTFDDDYGLDISTESIQRMDEKGWAFYGKFDFKNSVHKSAKFNMSYAKSEVGSPFRIVTERMGDFRVKHYGLIGGLSKKINDKWSLGALIDYAGDLHLRTRDTRNEQYNLTIDATLAASYHFNTSRSLSFGVAYYYKKTSNQYSNDFKINGSEYYLYNLNGLGDFDKIEQEDDVVITDQNPKFLLSYFAGNKNKLSLHLSFYPGNDKWNNRIKKLNSEVPEQLYKYEYLNNNFTGTYLVAKNNYELFNHISANFILGNGYEFRGSAYQQTYLYEGITASYSADLCRKDKNMFYKNKLGIDLNNIRKKDMTYAHEMKFTNLTASLKTGYYHPINLRNQLTIDVSASYKMNLDYLHQVVAAGLKPYTSNLAYNEMAYNTADVLELGTEATWFGSIGNIKAEYKIQYNYITPLDIKIVNNYSLLDTNANKNNISASISLFF